MTTLPGPAWLKGSGMDLQSTILCGDFNAVPASAGYRLAARTLKDVQLFRQSTGEADLSLALSADTAGSYFRQR